MLPTPTGVKYSRENNASQAIKNTGTLLLYSFSKVVSKPLWDVEYINQYLIFQGGFFMPETRQEKIDRHNRAIYIPSEKDLKRRKRNACITTILGKSFRRGAIQPGYAGEKLNIYPGYTEFRPHEPNMNLADKKFIGFKNFSEKSKKEQNLKNEIHYNYKANRYDTIPALDRFSLHKSGNDIIVTEIFDPSNIKEKIGKDGLTNKQRGAMLASESRIYIKQISNLITERSKRGVICCISAKSANRLKKLMCRSFNLDLWLDLTFSDDIFEGMDFQQRLAKAYRCLNKFERLIRSHGLHYIWKKEIKERLSFEPGAGSLLRGNVKA